MGKPLQSSLDCPHDWRHDVRAWFDRSNGKIYPLTEKPCFKANGYSDVSSKLSNGLVPEIRGIGFCCSHIVAISDRSIDAPRGAKDVRCTWLGMGKQPFGIGLLTSCSRTRWALSFWRKNLEKIRSSSLRGRGYCWTGSRSLSLIRRGLINIITLVSSDRNYKLVIADKAAHQNLPACATTLVCYSLGTSSWRMCAPARKFSYTCGHSSRCSSAGPCRRTSTSA